MTGRRILAVYAHPDDAEIWAGGTLLAHRALGDHTAVCILTHGDTARATEAQRGAELLGATLHHLALQDRGIMHERNAVEMVAAILRQEQPQIVLTHWAHDSHPDHVATWAIVRGAIVLAEIESQLCAVYWSDTYNSQGAESIFQPDVCVDVSAVWTQKLAALGAHTSQNPDEYVEMICRQGWLHGARAGVAVAEGFRRVDLFGHSRRAVTNLWDDV